MFVELFITNDLVTPLTPSLPDSLNGSLGVGITVPVSSSDLVHRDDENKVLV